MIPVILFVIFSILDSNAFFSTIFVGLFSKEYIVFLLGSILSSLKSYQLLNDTLSVKRFWLMLYGFSHLVLRS